ncbi:MAG: type II toxin-antitoxin system VapC family toxin [bacterium]|nr:type II toxin-antitoxin system VapC family toxin [bacterium]
MNQTARVVFDAGLFIGALLRGDPRHAEARPLVESARKGELLACTTVGILSEVYAALTWQQAQPRHPPTEAALAVRLLVTPPSCIQLLPHGTEVLYLMLQLAEKHKLTARRIHDARHAAVALNAGVSDVYTYDVNDWKCFAADGLKISGPESILAKLQSKEPSLAGGGRPRLFLPGRQGRHRA